MPEKVSWGRVILAAAAGGALAVGATAWFLFRPPPLTKPQRQVRKLVERYGPVHYSEFAEELIIRDFFGDRRGGTFLDVGAGDALADSTTAYLERFLGWHGIAVDAENSHRESFLRSRPATRFFAFFVSDRDDAVVDFYVNPGWRLSSGSPDYAARTGSHQVEKVPTITLNTLLAKEGVERIDFLSMDVEQAEPLALAGFDIKRFHPKLVCVEVQAPVAARIEDYMRRNGWVELRRYRDCDEFNRYYAPASEEGSSPVLGR